MAGVNTAAVSTVEDADRRYLPQLALVVSLYFGIGFITAMNDILVPHFKDLFHLSNVRALLVQFCFFGAYFFLSVPSAWALGRIGYKRAMVVSLAIVGCGLLVFVPASLLISYPVFLFALFLVGCGIALLQVAVNPYVGALGAAEHAASRLNLCGAANSIAGTIAPKIGAVFIFAAAGAGAAELARSVRAPYLTLAVLAFAMSALVWVMKLPELIPQRDRAATDGSAWMFRNLRLGAVAIFVYVGAEVTIGSLLINYLGQPRMGGMGHVEAARYVSLYWGGAMVGRLIGFAALRYVRQARALVFVSVMACLFVAVAVFGHGAIALWAIVSCGLFNSVMWPCIFPMALDGLGVYTSQASGILITMVVGGAIVPEIQGALADHYGYQWSFLVVLACYLYIVFFATRGHQPDAVARESIA